MKHKENTNIDRIIAKIDNDFNPDNSDWIPRVGAWVIDAMSQLNISQTEKVKRKVNVRDKIAKFDCGIDMSDIKVFDSNGCEVKLLEDNVISCLCPKGEGLKANDKNYVIVNNRQIELSYNTNFIIVEYEQIKTEESSQFNCSFPAIPNNGLLIECVTNYCMYKMLCRGYKHPVLNLSSNNPAINPYFNWVANKEKAKTSVIINNQDKNNNEDDGGIWRSAFYISTFNPK